MLGNYIPHGVAKISYKGSLENTEACHTNDWRSMTEHRRWLVGVPRDYKLLRGAVPRRMRGLLAAMKVLTDASESLML